MKFKMKYEKMIEDRKLRTSVDDNVTNELLAKSCEAQLSDSCEDAINLLWKEIILVHKPTYGDWEYPGQAYRHLLAEFTELRQQIATSRAEIDMLNREVSREASLRHKLSRLLMEHAAYCQENRELDDKARDAAGRLESRQ